MNIHQQLEKIFQDAFGIEKLTDELSIDNVPGWDSMAHVALIMTLQRQFAVSISPADAVELTDVAAIKKYLHTAAH